MAQVVAVVVFAGEWLLYWSLFAMVWGVFSFQGRLFSFSCVNLDEDTRRTVRDQCFWDQYFWPLAKHYLILLLVVRPISCASSSAAAVVKAAACAAVPRGMRRRLKSSRVEGRVGLLWMASLSQAAGGCLSHFYSPGCPRPRTVAVWLEELLMGRLPRADTVQTSGRRHGDQMYSCHSTAGFELGAPFR